LERHWRYTWQEKPSRRGKTPTSPHLHLHITSLGQVKWRNQEGSHAARHQLLTYMGDATTRATTQTPSPRLDTEGLTPKLLSSTTTTQTPTPGLDAEGLIPKQLRLKLLHLKLGIFLSSLCLSNDSLAHC
jgi:hypothetical protein